MSHSSLYARYTDIIIGNSLKPNKIHFSPKTNKEKIDIKKISLKR